MRLSVAFVLLVIVAGCRGGIDRAADRLIASGITVQRNSGGRIFRVDSGGRQLPDDFWETVRDIDTLTELSLAGSSVQDSDLTHLPFLPNLQTLDLSESDVTSSGLSVLSRMDGLQHLALNGIALDGEALEGISRLTRLRSLSVMECGLGQDDGERLRIALPGCLIVE